MSTFRIHSSVNGHLGRLHVFTTVNSVAINMGGEISSKTMALSALCICSEMSVGSRGSYVFDVLKKLHTVFHKGCRIHIQQCTRNPFFFSLHLCIYPSPSTHAALPQVALTCISLMIS